MRARDALGSGFAQFLYGQPNFSALSTSILSDNGWQSAALFFQDDWRVSPKLTLNLGMRWEFGNTEHERFNRVTGVDYSNGDFEIPASRKNLQPELGPQYPVEYVNNNSLLLIKPAEMLLFYADAKSTEYIRSMFQRARAASLVNTSWV